jgi:hypothetical protein
MKRWIIMAVLALLVPTVALAEVMYVQVEKARLLAKPSAFSRAKANLPYRTQVEVLTQTGAYAKVRCDAGTGYLAGRSLSVSQPKFSSKLSKNYVSSEEVAMATKGFNSQVESEYRKTNPNLPYAELDKLEAQTHYPDPNGSFAAFRRTGKLGEFQAGGEGR